jgi:ribosomal protein S18 acetylase RimI-like enzyme
VTRRANSALAEQHTGDIEEKLNTVEAFYASYHAPSRFQLCPASQPTHLESILLERGYQQVSGALVQTLDLATFGSEQATSSVAIFDKPNFEWFSVYRAVEKANPDKEKIRTWMLEHIQPKAAFALLHLDGYPAAVGLGVIDAGYLGIFNIATLESFRGRGCASTVLTALASWAKQLQAHTGYLQVANENHRAQKLYQRLGFRTLYTYTYFEKHV